MIKRGRSSEGARIAFCLLAAILLLGGCDGDTPTGPERVTTPLPGPLATVDITLVPATSPGGYRHAFTVLIDVLERRGTPIVVRYSGVSSGADYTFPERESSIQDLNVRAFGAGTLEVLVEHGSDVPCSAGLDVLVRVDAGESTEYFVRSFNCGTGFWPL